MKEETIDIVLDAELYERIEQEADGQPISDYIVKILAQCLPEK